MGGACAPQSKEEMEREKIFLVNADFLKNGGKVICFGG